MVRLNWRWGLLFLCSILVIGACGGSDSLDSGSTKVAPTATATSAIGGASSTATLAPQPTAAQTSSNGGGGDLGLDEALDQVIELYEELLEVLASVTDEASAKAAVDDVSRISSQFESLGERMEDFSQAEIASAFLSGRLTGFGEELNKEMIRIASDPAIFGLLAEAFGELN